MDSKILNSTANPEELISRAVDKAVLLKLEAERWADRQSGVPIQLQHKFMSKIDNAKKLTLERGIETYAQEIVKLIYTSRIEAHNERSFDAQKLLDLL